MPNTNTAEIYKDIIDSVTDSIRITLNSKHNQDGIKKYNREFIHNTIRAYCNFLYEGDGLDADRLTSLAAIAIIGHPNREFTTKKLTE